MTCPNCHEPVPLAPPVKGVQIVKKVCKSCGVGLDIKVEVTKDTTKTLIVCFAVKGGK